MEYTFILFFLNYKALMGTYSFSFNVNLKMEFAKACS